MSTSIKPYSKTLEQVIRMRNLLASSCSMMQVLTDNDFAVLLKYKDKIDEQIAYLAWDEAMMFFMFVCLAEGRSFDPPERGPAKPKNKQAINRDPQTGEIL